MGQEMVRGGGWPQVEGPSMSRHGDALSGVPEGRRGRTYLGL